MVRANTGLTVVAIPSKDDPVWQTSSEKVPHLTILFLGDQENNPNLPHMIDHFNHVGNTTMHRFGLTVDRRGTLGEKEADVLFFRKDYVIRELENFRSYLLANPYFSAAYNSVTQFPEWIPHLTLGYPDKPAHPNNNGHPGFYWVNFDTIALWTGDYEGTEIVLKDRFASGEMSMSEQVDDFLAHFGIKGMKWGVRRKNPSGRRGVAPEAKEARKLRGRFIRRNPKKLTNEELNKVIKRMELEKKFRDLSKDSSKTIKGLDLATDILKSMGKQAATEAAGGAARTYTSAYVAKRLALASGRKVINA